MVKVILPYKKGEVCLLLGGGGGQLYNNTKYRFHICQGNNKIGLIILK